MDLGANRMSNASGTQKKRGPLSGIRVLDMTRVLAGPFCSMILGDLGAEIIKVEEIEKGDPARAVAPFANGVSHYYLAINRNKKGIAVDARTESGRQIILDLAKHCDVLIENFRPDVMGRLGLSMEILKQANPRLIVCSISGFGKGNALSDKPSFDIIAQAMSGVMSINGESDGGPLKLGVPLGDLGAGLWGAMGVLAALQHRNAEHQAVAVDVSMLDSLMAFLSHMASEYFVTGESPPRTGNNSRSVVPYGRFPVSDGHIVLALHLGSFWRKFCGAVGHPEWIGDNRFRNAAARRENRQVLEDVMADVLRTRTAAEWTEIFNREDIPCAAVLDLGEALAQDVVVERGLVRQCDHPTAGRVGVVGSPLKFSGDFDDSVTMPAPLLGQHTAEVLTQLLGYASEKIERLARDNVIRVQDKAALSPPRSE